VEINKETCIFQLCTKDQTNETMQKKLIGSIAKQVIFLNFTHKCTQTIEISSEHMALLRVWLHN